MVWLPSLDIDPGDASWKTGVLGKTLDAVKQSGIRVARRTPDNVSSQEIFDECTAAHNDIHRGFSPWQLLLGKTPTDKTACEDPDLAQRSIEAVDEAAKQRLLVKEESYKACIEEDLSLRKRRKEIHQAQERETTAEGVRMKSVVWITEGTSLGVREKIVQHRGHRSHQFPRPCQTFATQHISVSHDTDRCS